MIKTLFFFLLMWVCLCLSLPFGLLALILRALGLGPFIREAVGAFARLWARLMMAAIGADLDVEGVEKVPLRGPVVFVGNHQGDFDMLTAMAVVPRAIGFTAKKEAAFFPLLNLWIVALDGVFIDRKNARKAYESIKRGAQKVAAGGSLIIFPEGRRSRGPAVGEFRPGALKLATLSEATIVPVTFDGSYRVWEEKKRIRGAKVRVLFHDPIPTAGLDAEGRRGLCGQVRSVIVSALQV